MLRAVDRIFEATLRERLPSATFRPIEARYIEEPRGRYVGQAGLVLAPAVAEELSTILRACADAMVPVVPYGGGTGLVGGQVARDGVAPVIVSLERMTRIRAILPEENILIAEAGAILADVQAAAERVDRLFPLSLASRGSARIGGNLATNAGGVNVLRYGTARDLCLGLEAVLPDGQICRDLTRLRKNNAGYDLRHLLIGSEGTLGIITAATLKLFPRPRKEGTALFVVDGPKAALALLTLAEQHLGQDMSAFELISRMGFDFLEETMPQIRLPFAERPEWMVLADIGLAQGRDPQAALICLFETALEAGLVSDGVIARSERQRRDLWALREAIPEANRRIGSICAHDVSVPLGAISEFIDRAGRAIATFGAFRINCFGHVGDGNLHYNVFPIPGETRADHDHHGARISRMVHDLVHELGGSISAEHGIGRLKIDDLECYADAAKLSAMRAIKKALDPKGIMNPGAVLRRF
ncbi:MAG: FAD-binding oxidoreductase [Pseudomonadota bacterium]